MKRIRRAKLFVFLRHYRHELLDEAFHQELAGLYQISKRGQPPIAPAQLALATILQAYTGVSDDEVIEATLMDRRWQLVMDCLDTDQAPFSKGQAKLRERVVVEHTLARVGQWQGRRTRYRGLRKNLLDLRRCAVVHKFTCSGSFPATLC